MGILPITIRYDFDVRYVCDTIAQCQIEHKAIAIMIIILVYQIRINLS